jgi:hypothetical protein
VELQHKATAEFQSMAANMRNLSEETKSDRQRAFDLSAKMQSDLSIQPIEVLKLLRNQAAETLSQFPKAELFMEKAIELRAELDNFIDTHRSAPTPSKKKKFGR